MQDIQYLMFESNVNSDSIQTQLYKTIELASFESNVNSDSIQTPVVPSRLSC